jgi:DNA-binding NarL/FixJ family response regulator
MEAIEEGEVHRLSGSGPAAARTVVVIAGLPSQWRSFERLQAQEAGLGLLWCPQSPTEVLDYCRRLVPCVLVVAKAFLTQVDEVCFREAIEMGRSIRVLVLLEEDDAETVEHALWLGCAGVLRADSSLELLGRAVQTVAQGELWVSRRTLSRLVQALLLKEKCGLTEREQEILRLVGQGWRNQGIAERLLISPQTVRWHLRSLYSKLGLHDRSRSQLLALGDRGLPSGAVRKDVGLQRRRSANNSKVRKV